MKSTKSLHDQRLEALELSRTCRANGSNRLADILEAFAAGDYGYVCQQIGREPRGHRLVRFASQIAIWFVMTILIYFVIHLFR